MTSSTQQSTHVTKGHQPACKLADYLRANGHEIAVGRRKFAVEGIYGKGGIIVATFVSPKRTYLATHSTTSRSAKNQGAEVWHISSDAGSLVMSIAIKDGQVERIE